MTRWAHRHLPRCFAPRNAKRYAKQRGALLWTNGTTRNTAYRITENGPVLRRPLDLFCSAVDTHEYELVSVKFPGGALAIAKAAPAPAPRQTTLTATPTQVAAPAYKGPPVGTVIEYDTWKCEVVRSAEFVTECRDPELGRVSTYGMIQPFGTMTKVPPLNNLGPVIFSGDWGENAIQLDGVNVSKEARNAIRELWPLNVGKRAKYKLNHDAALGGTRSVPPEVLAEVEVTGSESLTVAGRSHDTQIVSSTITRRYLGTSKDDNFRRTLWIDPKLGIVVKQKLEWLTGYRQGKTSEYRLVKVTFPQEAPVIAQAAPQAPVAQPVQAQQPPAATQGGRIATTQASSVEGGEGRTRRERSCHRDSCVHRD